MVTKSRLKTALNADKGTDFSKLHQKKVAKLAQRKKQAKKGVATPDTDSEEDEDEEEEEEGGAPLMDKDKEEEEDEEDDDEDQDEEQQLSHDLAHLLDDSCSSDSEVEMEAKIPRKPNPNPNPKANLSRQPKPTPQKAQDSDNGEDDEEEEEEEEEEDPEEADLALSDLEDLAPSDREDLVPHQRLTINNTAALLSSLNRIALPTDASVPFASHMTVLSDSPLGPSITDIHDDDERERRLMEQALDAAQRGRALLQAENVSFRRPNDYFAEMVKDDGHMEKIKARLIEQASAKKASAEARKQRELKKFGKQVQVKKMQERQKEKRETLEKVQSLKRKRQESTADLGTTEADLFDVGIDRELSAHQRQRSGKPGQQQQRGSAVADPNAKRQKKDTKFGFGGRKRNAKSGDAASAGDISGFSARRMKTGEKGKVNKTARLGKSRRKVAGKR